MVYFSTYNDRRNNSEKVAILGVSLTLLFGLNVGAIVPVTASVTGPNVTQQEPSQSMTTKANNALTAPATIPVLARILPATL